ncbi:tubulin epsilon chain, putative [Eimeria brunetti]|uniref:Tubulin epsilon chain, putative n=1 Tax=Eimeria brunetti TaxID=51314 RepID=U6LU58_9EIME|nr:tubulin epsilon chain, putative [Eimeria brunetti]
MPREVITFQIGQCGNQIGSQLWEVLLKEHGLSGPNLVDASSAGAAATVGMHADIFDEGISSIFKLHTNSRLRTGEACIRDLKARAILIDMEEGVVNRLLRGPLRTLFDDTLLITDAFLFLHSLGGGTGSGLGSKCLEISPGETDDVITSPYNAALALQELRQYATCVLPLCNDSLTQRFSVSQRLDPSLPFAQANAVAAQMLAHLTRFVCWSMIGLAPSLDNSWGYHAEVFHCVEG